MFEVKGITFDVVINRKRIKNLYLRVEDNKIIANAPFTMPTYEIYNFIESKRDWIFKTYDYQKYKERTTYKYHGTDTFYIYGVPYKIIKTIGKKEVIIRDNTIYLTYKDDSENSIKFLYKYLDKYLLSKAKEFYILHKDLLTNYGYNLEPEIKCKIMKSKWGVCYTTKNKIFISSYLIHYPIDCLEYIMVHEMTHFIIPNHSKRFYSIVVNYMPEYKIASDKLKQ